MFTWNEALLLQPSGASHDPSLPHHPPLTFSGYCSHVQPYKAHPRQITLVILYNCASSISFNLPKSQVLRLLCSCTPVLSLSKDQEQQRFYVLRPSSPVLSLLSSNAQALLAPLYCINPEFCQPLIATFLPPTLVQIGKSVMI